MRTYSHNKDHSLGSHYLGSRQYPLFKLSGFEVKIDLSWLLLALLITWTLAAGFFPTLYPDLAPKTYWWMGLTGALGLFLSIILHEFSHSIIARRYGMPIRGITLFIFGGVAEMEEEPPSAKSEFWMAIAGPIASFALSFVFYLLMIIAEFLSLPTSIIGVIYYLSYINLILAIFNLLPAFPLDGGRMLRAAIWKWKNNLVYATRISSQIGSWFGLLLIVLGILGIIQGNFIGGMWWLLIGAFLRGAAISSYSYLMMHEILSGVPIHRFMKPNPVTAPPTISIQQLVIDYFYKHHQIIYPVIKDSHLLGCVTIQDVKKLTPEEWGQNTVSDVMTPCSSFNTVAPDADSAKIFMAMLRSSVNIQLMVVDSDKLVGVISLTGLREYMMLKMDLEPTLN